MDNIIFLTDNLKGLQGDNLKSGFKDKDVNDRGKFSKILEDQKKYDDKQKIKHNENTEQRIKDKPKRIDLIEKKYQSDDDLEENMDMLLNSILSLFMLLEPISGESEEFNMEDLEVEIERILALLSDSLTDEGLPISYEKHQEIIEKFEDIDQLLQMAESELNLEDKYISMELIGFRDALSRIKGKLESKHMTTHENQKIDKESLDYKEKYVIRIQNDDFQEQNIDKDAHMEMEQSKENKEKIEDEVVIEIDDIKKHLELNDLETQIEGRISSETNLGIQDNEFENVDKKIIFGQVIDKAKLIVKDDLQEMRIKLKPDILGELLLKVEIEKGAFAAKILVDNYKTKELLEASLFEFKEELKDQGMEIKTFEVFVGTNEDFEGKNKQNFNFKQNQPKFMVKNNTIKGIRSYNDAPMDPDDEIYHDGQLNLYA